MISRAAVLVLAAAIDRALGDPPTRYHPVGAIGRVVRLLEACAPEGRTARRRYGRAVAFGLPAASALLVRQLPARLGARGGIARLAVDAALLSSSFALHDLLARAEEIEAALRRDDLDAARVLLGRHLVSREVDGLTVEEVAGATIASVAENLSDSVIAPWLWHAVCGVPAAWAYRASNTLDAMWGYRDEPYEDLGAAAALLDDALNLVPARVTALAICMAAVGRGAGAEAWRRWRREAGRTVSPNAGHPMAAMAGALDVRLIKRGAYVLGEELREPGVEDIADAVRLARRAAMGVAAVLALGLAVVSPPLGN